MPAGKLGGAEPRRSGVALSRVLGVVVTEAFRVPSRSSERGGGRRRVGSGRSDVDGGRHPTRAVQRGSRRSRQAREKRSGPSFVDIAQATRVSGWSERGSPGSSETARSSGARVLGIAVPPRKPLPLRWQRGVPPKAPLDGAEDFGGVEGARSAQGRLIKVTAEAPAVAWTARQSPARPLKRGGKRHAAGAQVLRTETEPSALHGARRRRSRPSGGDPRPREQTASVVRGPEPVDATTAGGGYGHPRAGVPPGTRVATKHIRSRSSTQPRLRSTVPRGKTTPPDPHREPAGAGHFRREPKVTETAWGRGAE